MQKNSPVGAGQIPRVPTICVLLLSYELLRTSLNNVRFYVHLLKILHRWGVLTYRTRESPIYY
jgi:hypothetical protein